MRTNIVLDKELVEKAFSYTDLSTKRELIDTALREFVDNHSRKDISELRGKISFSDDYNYKENR